MPLTYPELTGNSNVTISPERDEYVIIAASTITYTLPTITSNGSRYVFTRVDSTSNIVTLRVDPVSTNTISSQAGIFTPNVLIGNKTLSEVISYNGVWYVFFTNSLSTISTPSFNTSITGTNGNPFVSGGLAVWVPFLGTGNGDIITDFLVVAAVADIGINWSINPVTGGPITTIPQNTPQLQAYYSSTVSQVQLQPVTANPLFVWCRSNGSYYSLALY
jgi:hypothetical protein